MNHSTGSKSSSHLPKSSSSVEKRAGLKSVPQNRRGPKSAEHKVHRAMSKSSSVAAHAGKTSAETAPATSSSNLTTTEIDKIIVRFRYISIHPIGLKKKE